MLMKKTVASIFCALAVFGASAQQPWTLERCIDYAIENNIDVRSSRLEQYQGELAVTEAKDRFLPTASAFAQQSFSFGRGLTSDNTYADRNTSGFGVGAQLNLPVFQGLSAIRQLEYSRSSLRALVEQTEAAKDDVTLNVIGQYLQALYAGELLQVAREREGISARELERRRTLFEAGRIAELEIYEAEAQLASDRLAVVQAQNDSTVAVLDLAQLLNLPHTEAFAIEPLADEMMPLVSPETVFANALRTNHSVLAGELQQEAAQRNVSLAQTGYIPTLSLSAGLSTNYYKTSGFANESFGSQMRHNFAQSIGISLNVPIFDAFSTRNNVRRARVNLESARLRSEDTRNRLYKAIVQAYTQALGAEKKLESARTAAESSKAAFEAMQIKYDNGRANATEFEQSKSNYTNALAEAVQAKYERILRARILAFYNKD